MTTLPAELTLRVDEHRMLGQIGSLFGSIADALAEVVQNAHRAGATRLEVSTSGRTIVLSDNGPGLVDPELLFTVARSGWEAGVATDPAGMGAFALFALAEQVEIESVPRTGTPWTATLGAEAFAGARIAIRSLRTERRSGLTIRARLKREVQLPDLRESEWRHRFPLDVTVSLDGADPVSVPPVALWPSDVVIPTAVGTVAISSYGYAARRSRAVWEHRVVSFLDDPVRKVKRHLPDTVAGAVVAESLRGQVLEWIIDASSTAARPKLPDRTHLIDDAALDDALAAVASALVAQVDAAEIIRLATEAVRGRDILPDADVRTINAGAALGALGPAFLLAAVLPFLGFGSAQRATAAESWRVRLAINLDEHTDDWEPTDEAVWVRPRYRAESAAVELLALADGIPAVVPRDRFAEASQLPLVRLDAATLTAATSIGQIFATDLHFVTGGRRLGPVTYVYTRQMADEGAHTALPPKWMAALSGLKPGPLDDCRLYACSYWLGLHPLPPGMRAIDYLRRSRAFAQQALRESAADEWPAWFWDYSIAHRDRVDVDGLVRDLADRFAEELGPATAAEVKRETRALMLAARFAELGSKVRRALERILTTSAKNSHDEPASDLLAEIEAAGRRFCTLLASATTERLLSYGTDGDTHLG